MKLLALIKITTYAEDILYAIESLLASREYLSGILIESQGGPSILPPAVKEKLEQCHFLEQTRVVSQFKPSRDIPADTDGLLEVPPMCQVDRLAIEDLIQTTFQENANVYTTHFSLQTHVYDPTYFSFAYGWLCIALVFEWFWCAYERFKLPMTHYVRLTQLIRKGTQKMVAPWRFTWRFRNSGCHPTLYRGNWATISPSKRIHGIGFVKNWIFQHEFIATWSCWIGNWWFLLWCMSYWGLMGYLLRSPSTSLHIMYGVMHVCVSLVFYSIVQRRCNIRWRLLWCLLFPLYLLTFPLFMVYAKWSQPELHWAQRKLR